MPTSQYSPEEKLKIVIEVLKEERLIADIASEYELTPSVIQRWAKELLESAEKVFNASNNVKDVAKEELQQQVEIENEYSSAFHLNSQQELLIKKSKGILPRQKQKDNNKITDSREDKNYKAILIANALVCFAAGFYQPLLLVFLIDMGDMPLLGFSLGIITIFASISSYFVGELSDNHGRKPFLLACAIISPAIFIAYPLLPLLEQVIRELMLASLIILLIIDGILDGVWDTVEAVYLGDITAKAVRGSKMGSYWGIGGTIFGAATIIAGFSGLYIDFLTAAIFVSLIYLAGIFMLLQIRELTPKLDINDET